MHAFRFFQGFGVVALVALCGCGLMERRGQRPVAQRSAAQPVVVVEAPKPIVPRAEVPVDRWSGFASAPGEMPASANVAQVTFASDGAVFDPSVSGDGEWLVFASTQHRPTSDIYLKRIDSRVITQLTNDPAEDTMPAISPDGTRIAFASNRTGNWDIFVMPVEGGPPMQVTTDLAHEIHPSWSPDGTQLVFCRLGATSNRWEMWVAQATSSPVMHFVGYGMFPEWCPVAGTGLMGGDRILFQRGRERGDRAFSIWTIDFSGDQASSPTEIVSAPSGALINPSWSPDGKRIAYAHVQSDGYWDTRTSSESADLWMIDIDGANAVRLTDGVAADLMPVWRDETRILFCSDRGGRENIWAMDVGSAVRLVEGHGANGGIAGANESGQ